MYRSTALPPLSSADHSSVILASVYKPVVPLTEKIMRTVKTWTARVLSV